jgi:non-homologous end joining protein Ku
VIPVIREAVRKEGMVALGRVVFTSREHVIALEPRGKGQCIAKATETERIALSSSL